MEVLSSIKNAFISKEAPEVRPLAQRVETEALVAFAPRAEIEPAFDAVDITADVLMLMHIKSNIANSRKLSWQRLIDGHQSMQMYASLNKQSGEGAKEAAKKQKSADTIAGMIGMAAMLVPFVVNERGRDLVARLPLIGSRIPDYNEDRFKSYQDLAKKGIEGISSSKKNDAQMIWALWQSGNQPVFQSATEAQRWTSERERRMEGEATQRIGEDMRSGLEMIRRKGDLEQRIASMSN